MHKLIVIGAGGHARSVIDIVLDNNEYELVGCVDSAYPARTTVENMGDISIIGNDDSLSSLREQGVECFFVAIGDGRLRRKLYNKALEAGLLPINVISKHSRISSRAKLGKGICVMAGAVINVNCIVSDGVIVNTNCSIDHDCSIGEFSHIAPGTAISGTTRIGQCTHIGTNCAVIDGIKIGDNSYIGAGASVVSDIPDNVLAYGVPCRIVKQLEDSRRHI